MAGFEVYAYNIPQVSEDGKQAIPVPDGRSSRFEGMDEARRFAEDLSGEFDRVVLMEAGDEGRKLVERYTDGRFERAQDIVRR
jgi:hypothetical protein